MRFSSRNHLNLSDTSTANSVTPEHTSGPMVLPLPVGLRSYGEIHYFAHVFIAPDSRAPHGRYTLNCRLLLSMGVET